VETRCEQDCPRRIKPLLGAHLSIAGGHWRALELAGRLKCNCLQIFLKNQRQWRGSKIDRQDVERWHAMREKIKPAAIVGHGTYLLNLASADGALWNRSIKCLGDELDRCALLGIDSLVIHPGSHGGRGEAAGLKRVVSALKAVPAKRSTRILLETTAGQGTGLGYRLEHLAYMIDRCPYGDRLGVCVDTSHVFAAGYSVHQSVGYEQFMEQLQTLIGLDKLGCVHLNDSISAFGSRVDRHTHVGRGCIGLDCFRMIMTDPRLTDVPKIIETPKSNDKYRLTADRRNLKLLAGLAGGK